MTSNAQPNRAKTKPLPRAIEMIGATIVLFAAAIALQLLAGAYQAEFSNDDASHYISGLMIRDYARSWPWGSPVAYLSMFHSHYPLVGIGHWPPLYYFIEAVWMLLFSPARASMLLLSASVTVATAAILYGSLAARFGRSLAAFAALAFVAAPLVQAGTRELMLDAPVALFCLLAMLSYARYLETASIGAAVLFGLLASAALMIKGTAGCLALLPPLAVLMGRRWDLLRRASFWLPVPIVAILCAPWYILTYGLAAQGFRYAWGLDFTATAIADNARILWDSLGPAVLVAGAIGLAGVVVAPREQRSDSFLVSAGALFSAVWIFQSIIPAAIQDRYLASAVPPALVLAAAGLRLLCQQGLGPLMPQVASPGRLEAAAAIVLALLFLPYALEIEKKGQYGLIATAGEVWSQRIAANPSLLIASDAIGEGAEIAELAMLDPNPPGLFAVRGSRLLGGGGYNNSEYEPLFQTPEQVMAQIDEFAIPLVLFRSTGKAGEWAHLQQIREAQALYPDRWQLVYETLNPAGNIFLFRIRGNDAKAADLAKLAALSAPRSLHP